MDSLDNSAAAQLLYSIAMGAGCADSDEGPLVYNEDLDAFLFPDGRFACDRERADPYLAKALGLGQLELLTPRTASGLTLRNRH